MSDARETAASIAARLHGKRSGSGFVCDCPGCGYKRALRVSEREGKPVWWCASCTDRQKLTEAVLGYAAPARPSLAASSSRADEAADRREAAQRLWDATLPWRGTPVERYLRNRLPGVDLP